MYFAPLDDRQQYKSIQQQFLFPRRPIDFVADRKGYDSCPHCGETRVTDCIHDKLTFLCGSSGNAIKVETKCEKKHWVQFAEDQNG